MPLAVTQLSGFGTSKPAAGGAATLAFRSAGTLAATTTATITPGLPSGTAENDILICSITIGGNQGTTGFPTVTGWTLQDSHTYSVYSAALYWRRAGSSETATEFDLVTNDSSTVYAGVVYAFEGCTTSGTPFTDQNYRVQGNENSPDTTDLTPTTDDGLLCMFHGCEDNTLWGSGTGPPPTGWTLNDDQTSEVGSDTRIFHISYDTPTEDNATQIDSVVAGTFDGAGNTNVSCHGLVLIPA